MNKKHTIGYLRRDLSRIFLLVWNADRSIAITNIVLQFLLALLPVISLVFIKNLIDALVKGNTPFNQVILLIAAFGLVQFVLAIVSQYTTFINNIYQEKVTDHLSAEVLNKAIDVDYAYYENPAYHDTLHLAQLQSLYRAPVLLANFNSLLLNSLAMVFLIIYFFTLHSLFAVLFMGLSLPLAIIKWYYGFSLSRLEKKFAPLEREAGYLHNTLTNASAAKEVRVLGFGGAFIEKFNNIRQHIRHSKKKLHIKLTWYSLIAELVEVIAMAIIFGFLARYTWERTIPIAVFVIYIQGFQRLQSTSKNFFESVLQIFQQRFFLKDLFAFFDIETNINNTNQSTFPDIKKGLVVNKVSFTYPQTNKPVLHNINIECAPGKIIAIVGENGSGKSTLVKLLARLYENQSGDINIDDNTIGNIAINDFRSQSIFLFQDFEKYFLTIEENIALGETKQPGNPDAIQYAAKLAGAHNFITGLSKGYKTRMGRLFDGSEQISGGQWQKLALTRIFYKDTRLMVLDEPTSALDATAELELFNNVKENLQQKMVILITHRLYNLKIADNIYVMHNGHIVEEGSYQALIDKNGIFTTMYNAQRL